MQPRHRPISNGSTQQSSRLVALCFDANDPLGLARFWAHALGWALAPGSDAAGARSTAAEVRLVPTDGTRFELVFRPTTEPKSGKNRIHLDLTTASSDDQRDTVASAIERGARHIDIGQGPHETHVVLADPEGNEFCVIAPGNSFLAGCGRLGSITCDGSPQTGVFWSEALGWPLVWDQDEETAIRDPDGTGPFITWGPPVPPKHGANRLHLEIAPAADDTREAEAGRLVSLGAAESSSESSGNGWTWMVDPDGNEFCLVGSQ